MTSKNCTKCNQLKPLIEFSDHKSTKDGLQHCCRTCCKTSRDTYRRSKDGIISIIYSSQKTRSKHRGHERPLYTRKEFKDWMYKQVNFDALYLNWINSGYNANKKPSVDRLNDYRPYSFNNVRLTTWEINNKKAHADKLNGINNKQSKAVVQLSIGGQKIAEYYSAKEAKRVTGANNSNISQCCNNKLETAHGYRWKFKQITP